MRNLYILDHPGHLLHFDETIRALADRGHELTVSFGRPHKWRGVVGAATAADGRIEVEERPAARRSDGFAAVAGQIRAGLDIVHYLQPGLAGARWPRERVSLSRAAPGVLRRVARADTTLSPAG